VNVANGARTMSKLAGGLLCGLVLVVAGCGAGAVQSIGFGTGGSGCDLAHAASTFSAGSAVDMVAQFSPALPSGDTVSVTVSRDGTPVPELGSSLTLDGPHDCLRGSMSNLEPGHYQYAISSAVSTGMPTLTAQFDVTR
jgi:hypothetical protein